jgi:hypothetical protein
VGNFNEFVFDFDCQTLGFSFFDVNFFVEFVISNSQQFVQRGLLKLLGVV